MKTAARSPSRTKTPIVASARAKGLPPGTLAPTRTEPARAVPSEEPRLDTLRDRPEMSPWSCSGKADCTTLTDEVSMTPMPRPMSSRPGTKVQMPDCSRTSAISSAMPTAVVTNPARISGACDRFRASRPAARGGGAGPRWSRG